MTSRPSVYQGRYIESLWHIYAHHVVPLEIAILVLSGLYFLMGALQGGEISQWCSGNFSSCSESSIRGVANSAWWVLSVVVAMANSVVATIHIILITHKPMANLRFHPIYSIAISMLFSGAWIVQMIFTSIFGRFEGTIDFAAGITKLVFGSAVVVTHIVYLSIAIAAFVRRKESPNQLEETRGDSIVDAVDYKGPQIELLAR